MEPLQKRADWKTEKKKKSNLEPSFSALPEASGLFKQISQRCLYS
jgi:hypothetical protein